MGLVLVNFYIAGPMSGVDMHKYAPVSEIPIDAPHWAVGDIVDGDKPVPNVTNMSFRMHWQDSAIRGPTDLIHVPPMLIPPGETEVLWYLDCQIFGASAAWMCVHNVVSQGTPLACCIAANIGINYNCGDSPSTNVVLCDNTVVTSPTILDYALYILRVALNSIVQAIMNLLPQMMMQKLKDRFSPQMQQLAEQQIKRTMRNISRLLGYDPAKEIARRLRELGAPL